MLEKVLAYSKDIYSLNAYEITQVSGHDGGRNIVFICSQNGENRYILRVSALGDREETEYMSETEFVHYLAQNGAPVADVIPSINGKYVEHVNHEGNVIYISLFSYAKGILISDNGYRYRDGAPLSEYFYNTGKTLGMLHRLSKGFSPTYRRKNYFDKYNAAYINDLIPDTFCSLKSAILERLEAFRALPTQADCYGLVHFDFSDGNYHINMETGALTVFDFDNCMYCWYMFELANLWTHGVGWYQSEPDAAKRMAGMDQYFAAILEGYRSETELSDELLNQLQLFIDMVLIENIVDEFECCTREGEEMDYENIENAAKCLINKIAYAGFGEK
ncbi:MAG: phosphotransferase [Clostridia bacterium]|nr:phosphotransferase [Clostridia bacterium]